MTKTLKLYDAKCPECGHEFETTKKKGIQCFECIKNKKGKRFDL